MSNRALTLKFKMGTKFNLSFSKADIGKSGAKKHMQQFLCK